MSQKPGFFHYYERNDEVKNIEKQQELKKLTQKIKRMQVEINTINGEIEAGKMVGKTPSHAAAAAAPSNVNSFEQWFAAYGHPQPTPDGMLSSFNSSPKIYGMTRHHSAFKTQGTLMRKGRLIR
jgi:hypothetical protein